MHDLIHQVALHDPRPGAAMRSTPALFAQVPRHKSLIHAPEGKGLPIGNLTSQWFANWFLDDLDHLVTSQPGVGGHVRYCDDFVLLDRDRGRLPEVGGRPLPCWR